ncbi:hypothetical protein [Actinomadura litoris]|uniref:hypothetical protein n=1 Tax=Actinomadura litoris TaxID=2678616 RepID=UPI001FA7725E|nr:hypothetical protein [Actinomadura litoris]
MSDTPKVGVPGRRRGRPPLASRELTIEVVTLRRQGLSLRAIAVSLNSRSVPMPEGRGPWCRKAVDRLLATQHARDIEAEMDQR